MLEAKEMMKLTVFLNSHYKYVLFIQVIKEKCGCNEEGEMEEICIK